MKLSANAKSTITIVLLVAVGLGGVYWYQNRQPVEYQQGLFPTNPSIAGDVIIQSDYIRYPGSEGENAFELLKDAVGEDKVKYQEHDFGVFVEEINGLAPDAEHFWKLYYNGKESQVGADALATHKGDVLEWVVEKINK